MCPAYAGVDRHVCRKLRRGPGRKHKHKAQGRGTSRDSDGYLYLDVGLVRLLAGTRSFPRPNA